MISHHRTAKPETETVEKLHEIASRIFYFIEPEYCMYYEFQVLPHFVFSHYMPH